MSPALEALYRRLQVRTPAALRDGCQAVADEARRNAGPLAEGITVDPVVQAGQIVGCGVEARPVEGHAPPAVREFGSLRQSPQPFMRPAASRARQIVGATLARHLQAK